MAASKPALEVYADTFSEAFASHFPKVFTPDDGADADRARWAADPVAWVRQRLGEHVWSKQKEILESVRDHRHTAVPSCHAAGKSFIAARVAACWIESHPPGEAFVVTSAPTGSQVRAVLWREIRTAHNHGKLSGRVNQTEWMLPSVGGPEQLVAIGRKPADQDTDAFQGIHARYVLVIFDEAAGMPPLLWEAADSLVANEESRFLAIGNPTNPTSEFANVCKPGSGYNVIRIDAYDTPNFTGELIPESLSHNLVSKVWVQEKKRKWGVDHPMFMARVRGIFPKVTTDGLIPYHWVEEAQQRSLDAEGKSELGVDVGGGGDKSVVAHRIGPVVRIIRRDQTPNTMETTGNIISDLRETGASRAKVDEVGIGRGVVDRCEEMSEDSSEDRATRALAAKVLGVNVGRPSTDPEQYLNLRAEGYWALRDRFQDKDIDLDPDDEELAAQLIDIKFKRTSRGQIQIESKEEMKRRGKSSPDEADAVMLSCLDPPVEEEPDTDWMRTWVGIK